MSAAEPAAKELYDAIKEGDLDRVIQLVSQESSRIYLDTPFGSMLHVAASKGHLDIVRFLVEAGADVNRLGGIVGGSPVASAASHGHVEVLRYLIAHGGQLDVSEPTRNPLFGAIYGGHTEAARMLIDAGIDTDVKYTGENMKNMDAIAFAREWGRSDIVALLEPRRKNRL